MEWKRGRSFWFCPRVQNTGTQKKDRPLLSTGDREPSPVSYSSQQETENRPLSPSRTAPSSTVPSSTVLSSTVPSSTPCLRPDFKPEFFAGKVQERSNLEYTYSRRYFHNAAGQATKRRGEIESWKKTFSFATKIHRSYLRAVCQGMTLLKISKKIFRMIS